MRGVRELDLGGFRLAEQLVPETLFDHAHESAVQAWLVEERPQLAQRADELRRIEEIDAMPCRKVEVDETRHDTAVAPDGAVAEGRHHPRQVETGVEVGARNVEAAAREDVVATRWPLAAPGAEADDREVGGAAADIDDQHQRFARDRAFVVERGRDRLELEFHVAKARGARARGQRFLGRAVLMHVVVDEANRPPQDDILTTAARWRNVRKYAVTISAYL